jgi:2-isopropylmalate synthase/UPF0716 protein FxsA
MVSSAVAASIGGLNTFFEVLLSAIIGIYLLQNFKFSIQESIEKARNGQITQEEFIKTNAAKAIGAVLLIIPGFFTDFLGLALQFGFLTMLFSKIFKFKTPGKDQHYTNYSNTFTYESTSYNNTSYKKGDKDEIIDVEVIDDNKSIKH